MAGLCLCAAVNVAAAQPSKTVPACKAGQLSTKSKPCTAAIAKNSCPILEASGVQGGSASGGTADAGGTMGGEALGAAGAVGGVTLDCLNLSDGLMITAPGHTFSTSAAIRCSGACTGVACKATSATALTCKLSESLEKVGLKMAGSWQAIVSWYYAATDAAATNKTDGSCHIGVVATLTVGGRANLSKKNISVCAYSLGDAGR